MSYLTLNESLSTALKGIHLTGKMFTDKTGWKDGPDGWNNAVKRKNEYFDSMYTLKSISKLLIKEIKKVNGYLFNDNEYKKILNQREEYIDNKGMSVTGTVYSKMQDETAQDYKNDFNILIKKLKDLSHQSCIKKIHVGNKFYLLGITFDSDNINKVSVATKHPSGRFDLVNIPFNYDSVLYKKNIIWIIPHNSPIYNKK